jgi:F-type H+-transporting ATPase subunit delta
MAELATIARPYAEALFKATAPAQASALVETIAALAQVSCHPKLQEFASSPKASTEQVLSTMVGLWPAPITPAAKNLLQVVIENDRLAALPEIAAQFQTLVQASSGVLDATVYSAHPIAPTQLGDVMQALEKRFNRKLVPHVVLEPELIGGIRVVVGDQVLDTSVKARLEQMKAALTA